MRYASGCGQSTGTRETQKNNKPCLSPPLLFYDLGLLPLSKGRDVEETDRSCLTRKLSAVLMAKGCEGPKSAEQEQGREQRRWNTGSMDVQL